MARCVRVFVLMEGYPGYRDFRNKFQSTQDKVIISNRYCTFRIASYVGCDRWECGCTHLVDVGVATLIGGLLSIR